MIMCELDGSHLLPVRLGHSADIVTLSHDLVTIQRQTTDVLRRSLFPLSWEELEIGVSLTALNTIGQVAVVKVLERVDSTELLAAMSRLTQAIITGRREIASRYVGGLGAFSQGWNKFREAMPAQIEAGSRLTVPSASLESDVAEGLGVLAFSGLRIHEMDVCTMDGSRIVVAVKKISGMDAIAGRPLLVAHTPRPTLAGSVSSGSNGSRGVDATEQTEYMSPVTGPTEIVMPPEPVTVPEAGGVDDASAAVPAEVLAATGAVDALPELFESVVVTAEQPLVHALSVQDGGEAPSEGPEEAGDTRLIGQIAPEPDEGTADVADSPADDGTGNDVTDNGPTTDADRGTEGEAEHRAKAEPKAPQSRLEPGPESSDGTLRALATESAAGPGDSSHPDHAASAHNVAGSADSVGQDLADILGGDTVIVPAVVDPDEESAVAEAGHPGGPDSIDGSSVREWAIAVLAGGVGIPSGSGLSEGSGSATSAGEAPSPAGSRIRMGRRSRAAHSQPDVSSATPAAQAWSTIAPNESCIKVFTDAVPLVSWEPPRGSVNGLDSVVETLGGDPPKSLQVQETVEPAVVTASLGKPIQIV